MRLWLAHADGGEDGNDLEGIDEALRAAQKTGRPSLVLVRTHIGYGSPGKQDTFEAHGSPLGTEEVKRTKQKLGWPAEPPFLVPQEALARFRESVGREKSRGGMEPEILGLYAKIS